MAPVLRSGLLARRLLVAAVCVLLFSASVEASSLPVAAVSSTQATSSGRSYPTASWALGVVVPEGASLQGGSKLRWESVRNVTAAFTLPNVTMPDRIVYAVMSLMTSDGGVMQAAAGIRPDEGSWFAYSWSIPDFKSVPLIYRWSLNSSEPEMAPGADVTISIFQSSNVWTLRIQDDSTGARVERAFLVGVGTSLKAGDQEVFSLESYSRLGATFRDMGNLTLRSLLVDGARVTGGVYAYGDWEPRHNPLFAVGSSGVSPPSFISLGQGDDGSFIWGYDLYWGGSGDSVMAVVETLALLLSALFLVIGVVLWKTRGPLASGPRRGSPPAIAPGAAESVSPGTRQVSSSAPF